MNKKRIALLRCGLIAALGSCSAWAWGQTTAGTSVTVVVPVIAQTSSFGSEVTAYNPNAGAISVNVSFYDAQNTASPGAKACTPLSVGAGASVEFSLASQCALPSGANFGLLLMSESTGTQRFYGYARTQTPQGVGFSTEGFPIENFNDQLQHATGLKRVAASAGLPAYQSNCFLATLGDSVSYELRLFNGATGAQIGTTLSGSLAAYQQLRYLDVFSQAGVTTGDYTNVRAQFTNLTASNKRLIGFCTVQENTSFSADFRIAKSYGGTLQNAFVQGGNGFGTAAVLGTIDNQALAVLVHSHPVMSYLPTSDPSGNFSVNIVGGHPNNSITPTNYGQTIAGGGQAGSGCYDPPTNTFTRSCGNQTMGPFATIDGGVANIASGDYSTVAGGFVNTASGFASYAAGYQAIASAPGMFAWADTQPFPFDFATYRAPNSSWNTYNVRATGGVVFVTGVDSGTGWPTWECYTYNGGGWTCSSDRNLKRNLVSLDGSAVLAKLIAMPVYQWQPKDGPNGELKHVGPMAQDFYAAFGLGDSDKAIGMQDAEGVALAAIQGLNRQEQENQAQTKRLLQDKDAKIEAQQRAISALMERMTRLESMHDEIAQLKAALAEVQRSREIAAAR